MLIMLTFDKTSDMCSVIPDNKGRFSLLLIVDKNSIFSSYLETGYD